MTEKIELNIEFETGPPRVFDALTRPDALEQWFAERAFVSETEKRYDFWGRFTPDAPGEEAGRHRLRVYQPDERLGFDWRLRGEDTTVEMRLEEAGGKTLLRFEQDVPARPKTECAVGDFWMLSFENLRRWLKDGSTPVRCDYSEIPRGSVELSIDFEADRDAVFGALLGPDELNRWIAAKAEVDPVLGGRMSFGWEGEGPVKILEIVPSEKLAYSWRHGDEPETVVSWSLEGSEGKTRLLLVHSGFGDRATEDFRTGWLKHVLWMKAMLEQGESWTGPELVSMDHQEV